MIDIRRDFTGTFIIENELCVAQPLVEQEFRERRNHFFLSGNFERDVWSLMDAVF